MSLQYIVLVIYVFTFLHIVADSQPRADDKTTEACLNMWLLVGLEVNMSL
jgi:hypothetical protein